MGTIIKIQLKRICILLIISSMFGLLFGCSHKEKKTQPSSTIITVTKKPVTKTLYFSGTIQPLQRIPVMSPVEGVVYKKFFTYGHKVNKGDLLFEIKSYKQESDYQAALSKYLQAKQKLSQSKEKLEDSTTLFNQGLIPKNEYESDKNTYFLDQLSFIQAQAELNMSLKYHQVSNISELSISDIEAVSKALELGKKAETIRVYAPHAGIALFTKSADGDSSKRIGTGSRIRQSQVLLYIGSMEGVSSSIQVNEVNVNQLHVMQKAIVTSTVVPNLELNGYVSSIDAQAASDNNLPVFNATVVVPTIGAEQQKLLHVGMSAKVSITISLAEQILIPIRAVLQENGNNVVKVLDPKTGNTKSVIVDTGQTTINSIVINSGLNPGDKIVVPN